MYDIGTFQLIYMYIEKTDILINRYTYIHIDGLIDKQKIEKIKKFTQCSTVVFVYMYVDLT